MPPDLGAYLRQWGLTPDGDLIQTRSSRLLPVRRGPQPAMLKIARHASQTLQSAQIAAAELDAP